jgi:hypothetical protein
MLPAFFVPGKQQGTEIEGDYFKPVLTEQKTCEEIPAGFGQTLFKIFQGNLLI